MVLIVFDFIFFLWQLLDLPGIIEGAKDGKGRGRQVIAGKYLTIHLCLDLEMNIRQRPCELLIHLY